MQARFRLSEMDSERRLGEGRLAQLAGPSELASDRFELRLGLLRTAQREWAATPRSSPAGQALLSYAQGINDDIAQVRAQGDWPAEFSLTRVYPSAWTPVDSLVVQGVLTQELDFTTTPLDYALLEKSLGRARTMAWFPVNPPNQQSPFDPGPYRDLGLTQVAADAWPAPPRCRRPVRTRKSRHRPSIQIRPRSPRRRVSCLRRRSCRRAEIHRQPDSNAWAANGPAVAGNGAMLAGDPHLPQTLPSIWYEAAHLRARPRTSAGSSRARPARRPDRAQPAHRLVADGHPEPGHAVLRGADQLPAPGPVLLAGRLAADDRRSTTRSRSAAAPRSR